MMKVLVLILLLINGGTQVLASTCSNRGPNVILFMWDGVRNQEFFNGTDFFHRRKIARKDRGPVFERFWSKHAPKGIVLGEGGDYRLASSVAISLPSYQSIMVGHATTCRDNSCKSIDEDSFLENIRNKLNLKQSEVAAIASWEGLQRAVAKDRSQITTAIFPEIREDEPFDSSMIELQKKAMKDLPKWEGSRKDHYTFQLAMSYLKKNCPRVLYISLVDSDEYGHADDYASYINTLRVYDGYLDELINTLNGMGEYGQQTSLLVTTDHNRGDKMNWKNHGYDDHSNKDVFLFMKGRKIPEGGKSNPGNHSMIRGTIERLMGIDSNSTSFPSIRNDLK